MKEGKHLNEQFCSNCGVSKEGKDKFCRKCGTPWPELSTGGAGGETEAKSAGGFTGKAFLGGFVGCLGVLAAGFVVLVILGVVVAVSQDDDAEVVSSGGAPTARPADSDEPDAPGVLNLNVGDTAKVGDAEVTVNSFRLSSGDGTFGPDPGNVYVIVDTTVRNTGSDAYNISSILQTAARDGDGREYNVSIALGATTQGQLDGTIPPGDILRGETAFEVPQSATGLQFVFSQSLGSQQARWNLR